MAVGVEAFHRHEKVAWLSAAGIVADTGDLGFPVCSEFGNIDVLQYFLKLHNIFL